LAGDVNIQGEEVKKLDVIANNIFINSLRSSGKVAVMVSEENEEAIFVPDAIGGGGYCVVFDPLDGSSNIDSGVSIGTIFGIYHVVACTSSLLGLNDLEIGFRRQSGGCAATGKRDGCSWLCDVRQFH
jgi:fructose-1,6-bisphosphatase